MHQIKEDLSINFCGATLKHNNSVKYLGYSISCKVKYRSVILNDQIEIQKRKCEIYMKANMISSQFRYCSNNVKNKLFSTHFSSIYCCSLWNTQVKKTDPIKVAFNNGLRIVYGLRRDCSASQAFVERSLNNIDVVIRTAIFSLKNRIQHSKNIILSSIYNNITCNNKSKLSPLWNKILLTQDWIFKLAIL